MSLIAQKCLQKSYRLAVSNPCFELWLLLHIKSLSNYTSEELQELARNAKINHRTKPDKELVNLLGSYNRANLDTDQFLPFASVAIERAKALDVRLFQFLNDPKTINVPKLLWHK